MSLGARRLPKFAAVLKSDLRTFHLAHLGCCASAPGKVELGPGEA